GDALAGDAGRDLTEILCELDADLARQEADLRQRRARLARLLGQAEAGGQPSGQAPVSAGLAGLFGRMADVAAQRPGPEPAMGAAADGTGARGTGTRVTGARGTGDRGTGGRGAGDRGAGWPDVLTRTLDSEPGA